jgi:hypothetical protein
MRCKIGQALKGRHRKAQGLALGPACARLERCVRDFAHANHPPVARVQGSAVRAARPGETVTLDASGSRDPAGRPLRYEWFFYPEAGSYRGPLPAIHNAGTTRVSFTAPPVGEAATLHLILRVSDNGTPLLARYRRVVVTVSP